MFDIPLRKLKDQLTHPISFLIPTTITPNLLTLLAFIAGLLSCYTATFPSHRTLSVALWLTNRLLDCLDGSVARTRGLTTETGGFLDLLSDFIIYSLLPLGIACNPLAAADWRAIAVLEATFHINNFVLFYIAAVASKKGNEELTSVTMRPALVEGFESGVLFTVMLVWPAALTGLAWGMSAAVAVGVVQRVLVLLPILRQVDGRVRQVATGKIE